MIRELSISVRDGADSLREIAVTVAPGATPGRLRVTVFGEAREVDAVEVRPGTYSVILDGRAHLVDLEPRGRGVVRGTTGLVDGVLEVEDARQARLRAATRREGAAVVGERIVAPIAGKIVKVLVDVGDVTTPGQPVVVVEAMKMENEIATTRGGTVRALGKPAGSAVDAGELLVDLG
ncbi:MAG: biotin/lipoyl-containing protein [Kofleriaceae bacterium]